MHTQWKEQKTHTRQNKFIWTYNPNPDQVVITKQSTMWSQTTNCNSEKNNQNYAKFDPLKNSTTSVSLFIRYVSIIDVIILSCWDNSDVYSVFRFFVIHSRYHDVLLRYYNSRWHSKLIFDKKKFEKCWVENYFWGVS